MVGKTIVQGAAWYLVEKSLEENPTSQLNDLIQDGEVIPSNELTEYGHTYDPLDDIYLESSSEVKDWLAKFSE